MQVKVVKKVLGANDAMAEQNRSKFADQDVFVLNMMSAPGSGKTTLLQKTLAILHPEIRCAVIVGDICTSNDAERLAEPGIPVVQINTDAFGGDCHLAAHVIAKSTAQLDLGSIDLLIIENIGNLVCPAEFDIGEDKRVVVLSITEGEDKPAKYPLMFRVCDAALLNKMDLLPHLDYDLPKAVGYIHKINPNMPVFKVSAKSEAGIPDWIEWLKSTINAKLGRF